MGIFATDKHQITLIYNAQSTVGKQTYAYVTASNKKLLSIDTSSTKITGTQWVEIADKLACKVSDLIEKKHPAFTKKYGTAPVELCTEDAIKILQNHPECLVYAIVINGHQFIRIGNPSDITKYLN